MERILFATMILSVLLLLSGVNSFGVVATKVTAIKLNRVATMAYIGDELMVTGRLVEAGSGEGIAKEEIKIIDNKPSGQDLLVSSKTRKYGFFTAKWETSKYDPRDSTMHLIVKYDGSSNYTASVSREHTIMVIPLPIEIKFQYLKSNYDQGEIAEIIFTTTSLQNPIQPDVLHTNFNSKSVMVAAYGKGNYVYETEPLSKGHNQFFVNAGKEGYSTVSLMITISVC